MRSHPPPRPKAGTGRRPAPHSFHTSHFTLPVPHPKKGVLPLNLPNILTVVRCALVPLMAGLCYLPEDLLWIPGAVFALAASTDWLDGYLARKHNLITDFGKFLDPLADKLLVLTALVMLVHLGRVPAWLTAGILARELAVDGLRMIAVGKGRVIAAAWSGKVKTFSQMGLILLLFFTGWAWNENPLTLILCAWVAFITLFSGVQYFVKNGDALKSGASGKDKP